MADLHALIRVRRHAVEQKQKVLGELYRKVEELETQKKELHETLAVERLKVDEMGVAALGYFGRYSEVVRERSDEIDEALKKLNNRIEIAREDMRIAFSELKKIEITQEAREKAEEKKRNKKESDLMDDIAIDGFRRKTEEEQR